MVDRKDDLNNGEEVKMQPWPSRAAVSPLEEALHHWFEWGDLARFRVEYEFPYEITKIEPQEIADKLSRSADADEFREAQEIIKIWNQNPDAFRNPFEQNISLKQTIPTALPKREVVVEVRER